MCGRVKDLIIVRGRNHYPQDIERTCEAISVHVGVGVGTLAISHSPKTTTTTPSTDTTATAATVPATVTATTATTDTATTSSLRGGCSAAFSVPIGGQEQLVYVAEISDTVYESEKSK